jgi:type VI secretion system protein ImpL
VIAKILGLVFNRWVLLAVLLLAAALVIWLGGPQLSFANRPVLESASSRWIAIGVMVGATLALVAWKRWRARRGNAALVSNLVAAPPAGAREEPASPDMVAVRERFANAMQVLRNARFGGGGLLSGWSAKLGGRFLYEMPWYLIIGAPGSGKTTALRNCGLRFPLAEAMGEQAMRGVGGTRHCDWWFTDQAVLIDTAGRFTTQDSDAASDRATWDGFLALLKRSRPRQPLNGVLVTVSVTDLLLRDGERQQYAAAVRRRIQELHERLGIRFPIYLLVTKSDLLAGFTDYFAPVDKEQRATPWGATFPAQGNPAEAQSRFGAEFDALAQRLDDGLIERAQAERDPQRRARIYGFPGQFAALRGPLQEFLAAVFASSPYQSDALLRGFYFVSGTQEGTPIDRVLGSIARRYGLERAVVPPLAASGKSYFLARLLGEVVFAEAGLAGTDLKWERRRKLLTLGAYAAIAALSVGLVAAWGTSYVNNRRYVADVTQRVDDARKLVQSTPNRATPDLMPVLPALDITRGLAQKTEAAGMLGFGLDQRPKLDAAARNAYDRMLVDSVLPRIGLRVEEDLRLAGTAPDSQYEILKAYLMLHDVNHFEPDALKAFVEADWDARLGRSIDADSRAHLSQQLDALLAQGPVASPLPADQALIDATRLRLAGTSLPQRIYTRMRQRGLGSEFPDFSIVRAGGPNASNVFRRESGGSLDKAVPGIFSYDGYHRGFQGQVASVAAQLASEQGWVLGVKDAPRGAGTLLAGDPLVDQVRRLYLTEYASTWESLIADIKLQPMASLSQSIQMAQLLSAPDSPLPPLLKAISRETTLTASGGKSLAERFDAGTATTVQKGRAAIASALGTAPAAPAAPSLEQTLVDDRFAGLRGLVTAPEGGKAPLADTMDKIGQVQQLLVAADTAIKGGTAPQPSPLPTEVKVVAARSPEPLRGMLDNLSATSAHVSQTLVRENLGREVKSAVGEFCQQAVAGRYPLDRSAARDATQADFALLFGPGGKIDSLMQQRLAPYVDTTTRPWRFRPVEGTPLGTDTGTLPQFQRAQAIKETFFPNGNVPSLKLEFKPIEMDASMQQFILDVDGQVVRYAHGPQIPTSVSWPGPRGSQEVHVEVTPQVGTSGMTFSGPWALFRLFDRVAIEPAGTPERFRATFDVDGRKATFEVTASSVRNPFRLRELGEFSCPQGL